MKKAEMPLPRVLAAILCPLFLGGCAPLPMSDRAPAPPGGAPVQSAADSAPADAGSALSDGLAVFKSAWQQDPSLLMDLSPTRDGFCVTDAGAYKREGLYDPRGSLLYFFDAADGGMVPLCALPNCAHSGADCTAWLYGQEAYKALAADGESLYFFRTPVYDAGAGEAQSDSAAPALVRTGPTGADAQMLYRCASGESLSLSGISSAVDCARDQGHLYFFTSVAQEGAAPTPRLMTLTLATGEVTARPLPALAEGEHTYMPHFAGVWGRRLLLEQDAYTLGAVDAESGVAAIENQTTHLYALDPATLKAEELCRVPPDCLDAATGQFGVHTVRDGVLYSFRYPSFDDSPPGGYALTAQDPATGEQRTLFEAQREDLPGQLDYTYLPFFLAGQVFFCLRQGEWEFDSDDPRAAGQAAPAYLLWAVDLTTGEARDATVPCAWSSGAQGALVPRALLAGGRLLAEAGSTQTPFTHVWEDGTVTEDPIITPHYVLISPADLLAGQDTAVPVPVTGP